MMQNPRDFDEVLRESLRAIPSPAVSSDFDAHVLEALSQPEPWWRQWWASLRPTLAAMCCSLVVTLIVVSWTLNAPSTIPSVAPQPVSHTDLAAVDRALNSPNLRADTLQRISRDATALAPPIEPPSHGSPPVRHAQRPERTLFA
jgi:hypothetical protein